MYLSYLDESGSPGDRNTPFFVLGGFSVFERQTHWIEKALEEIADRYQQRIGQYLELHAAPMRSGKDGWEKVTMSDRLQAASDVLRVAQNQPVKLFACVIEQNQFVSTAEILPYCYEVIAAKFDDFLAYSYQRRNDPQRGMFVLDRKHAQAEKDMQILHQTFKTVGHSNGRLRNFAEVPLFADSKSTRLIQLADSVAYWIFRRYSARDDWGWRMIHDRFANLGNSRTGLHEVLAPSTPMELAAMASNPYPVPPALPAASEVAAATPVAAPIAPAARMVPGAHITL
jgi:hypothetical protein